MARLRVRMRQHSLAQSTFPAAGAVQSFSVTFTTICKSVLSACLHFGAGCTACSAPHFCFCIAVLCFVMVSYFLFSKHCLLLHRRSCLDRRCTCIYGSALAAGCVTVLCLLLPFTASHNRSRQLLGLCAYRY